MFKLLVFLFFFIAVFFVPAWPLLLLVGLLYLVACLMVRGSEPDGDGGVDPPDDKPPASPGGRWTNFTRSTRQATKPFRKTFPRSK